MSKRVTTNGIPRGLFPYFQEYDPASLDPDKDADLIIQRGLEFGTWEDARWLFKTYRKKRIIRFLQERGERLLSNVTFNYWRKLLGIKIWQTSPFASIQEEIWKR